MDIVLECLTDAAVDTLKIIPFLIVTYFALVAFEFKAGEKTRSFVAQAGSAGPLVGSLLGAVPQCGFSAAAAMLYAGRVVTLGTLFAVFLSTSDEMLPLMIAQSADVMLMLKLLGIKVLLGMVTGFLVDLAIRVLGIKVQGMGAEFVDDGQPEFYQLDSGSIIAIYPDGTATLDGEPFDLSEILGEAGDEEDDETDPGATLEACGPGCACGNFNMGWRGIAYETVYRSAQVTFFVFVVTLALNLILGFAGEDFLADVIAEHPTMSVLLSALVGLIPNCAASVAITQLYLAGVLELGATMAGLLVSAGIGLVVLFTANRSPRQNIAILATLYVIGVVWGVAISLSGIVL